MAGLKMNVEFPTRLCEVKGELGYFHLWEQWSNVVDASLLRGGHPAGQIGQVYGIVEFKDGVRRVDPVSIKFCDEENADLCALVKHNEALRKGEAKFSAGSMPFVVCETLRILGRRVILIGDMSLQLRGRIIFWLLTLMIVNFGLVRMMQI